MANSLNGFLEVYAYKTIPAFIANMPPRDMYTEDFDSSIAQQGTAVITRIPTTVFGSSLNNLDSGWESQNATSSAVTVNLATSGGDHKFTTTQWATIGEQQLFNTFGGMLSARVANGITISLMNNVTTASFANVVTVNSSSLFSFTGSNSLQSVATSLSNLEIPQGNRYVVINPNAYQNLTSQLYQQYVYGDQSIVRYNGYQKADGTIINSANPGLYMAGFNAFPYARIGANGSLPYGGGKVAANGGLFGFAGHKSGLAFAARTPITQDIPLMETYNYTDPTSGFPVQFILAFDTAAPAIRLGVYSLFGSAVGNTNAIVPLISASGV